MRASIRLKKIPTDIFYYTCSSNCMWYTELILCSLAMQIVSKHIMVHIIRRTVCQIDVVVVNLNIFPMWITWGYAATIMEAEHESSEYWHLDIIQWIAFLPIIKILSSNVFSQFISEMIKSETFVFEDLMWLEKDLICLLYNKCHFATPINAV